MLLNIIHPYTYKFIQDDGKIGLNMGHVRNMKNEMKKLQSLLTLFLILVLTFYCINSMMEIH